MTIVAACIKAETGVGPSIASGSHVCKKICADFPIAPINNKKHIRFIELNSNPKNFIFFSAINGIKSNTSL